MLTRTIFQFYFRYLFFLLSITLLPQFVVGQNVLSQRTDSDFIFLSSEKYSVTAKGLPIFSIHKRINDSNDEDSLERTKAKISYSNPLQRERVFVKFQVIYPEFEYLTKQEEYIIKKNDLKISDTLNPQVYVGISKKNKIADIRLCPIVKKNGRFMRLKSFKLTEEIIHRKDNSTKTKQDKSTIENSTIIELPTMASKEELAERWHNSSVLSSGKWLKISVKEEGIYQLTAKQLNQHGFTDIKRVKIFGYGGRIIPEDWNFTSDKKIPDDLCEVSTILSNDKLIFFAEGITRWNGTRHENNPYSSYSCYFITEGDNPLHISEETTTLETSLSSSIITHHVVVDNDVASLYEGGRELYDGHNFAEGNPYTFKVSTPTIVGKGNAQIDIALAASGKSTTSVNITLNDSQRLSNMSISPYGSDESARESRKSYTIAAQNLKENNEFKISISPTTTARLNYIRISYPRALKATDAPYSFSPETNGPITLKIANASKSTQLWQIANGTNYTTRIQSQIAQGDTLMAKIKDGTQRFVIYNEGQDYPSPTIFSVIKNQNLHADSNIQMVIIIPSDSAFVHEAKMLAEAHKRVQQFNVKIVKAQELYNEFSSGTPDASAYRRYLKMLYDRAEKNDEAPRFLLFMGPCLWDNRLLTSSYKAENPEKYLLAFEVSHNASNNLSSSLSIGDLYSYVTDDFFSWLDDNEGSSYGTNKPDIAVGRMPCTNAEEAKIMVEKSIAYLEGKNMGPWQSRAYVLGDDRDNNLHMIGAEDVAKSITSASEKHLLLHKVYWDAYNRTYSQTGYSYPQASRTLQRAMADGALIFDYIGHGSPDQISHAKILEKSDFANNSSTALPLWIMASCKISPYDTPQSDIGRTALINPNGGAVAVLCASRSVVADRNVELNTRFCQYLLSSGSERCTFGEALLKTKTALVTTNTDATINKLKYALLGDPALPIALPQYKIIVDSINGVHINNTTNEKVKACSIARFSGHIEAMNAVQAKDFSGIIYATLSDKTDTITCKNNADATTPMVYQDRTKTLIEINDSVVDGFFTLNIPIPQDISYSSASARLTLFASATNLNKTALGYSENFSLNGTSSETIGDTIPPQVFISLNDFDFPNGGITNDTPLFLARISDNVAINTSSVSLGHDMNLCIDNDPMQVYSLNNYFTYDFGAYNTGYISWQLPTMTPGTHILNFKVWDVNNNSTTAQLKFIVGELSNEAFDINAIENPVHKNASFVIYIPKEDDVTTLVETEIFDAYGRLIWSKDSNPQGAYHTITWNADAFPAGIYLYRATMVRGNEKMRTAIRKLIVK